MPTSLSAPITCIGLDLAWSPRNPSGAAVIRGTAAGGRLAEAPVLLHDIAEIVAYVVHHSTTATVLVTVDAPLCVPNQCGSREAEKALGHCFGRYEAGAHSASRARVAIDDGQVRGALLVAALAAHGFREAAGIASGSAGRAVTEVYPHAAMVGMFGLPRTLKYKARGSKRTWATRVAAWQQYQHLLRGLTSADPPLIGHEPLLAQDVTGMAPSGKALKAYEDQVDALVCAYVALYAYRWGAQRCRTFGTLEEGHIFTPVPASEWHP